MKMSKIHPSHYLENIKVETSTLQLSSESIYDSPHHTLSTKCRFLYDSHKKKIITLGVILIITIIIIIIVANSNPSSNNPCIDYSSEDYASSVSMKCFRYLWEKTCHQNIPNDFDGGWWRRSPSGGRMIPCIPPIKGNRCGAGSYKIMTTYLYICNLYYGGY